jgi:hypothetical protein
MVYLDDLIRLVDYLLEDRRSRPLDYLLGIVRGLHPTCTCTLTSVDTRVAPPHGAI